MVGLLVYVFAIFLYMFLKDENLLPKKFGTLGLCMWTLMLDGTIMDNPGSVLRPLLDQSTFASVIAVCVFLLFVLLSASTVMNMLIGVLCEVVSAVGHHEREEAAIRLLKQSILVELLKFDKDGDALISKEEFEYIMKDESAMRALVSLGVDVHYLRDYQNMLYEWEAEYSIEAIMQLCLVCRG